MAHKLDAYKDLVGKVPNEKIAETAGVSVDEVEAWLKGQDAQAAKKPAAKKPAAKKPAAEQKPVEVIRVKRTTAISVETVTGRRVRVPVPRSIYRGEVARKYASILREDEYEVLSRQK